MTPKKKPGGRATPAKRSYPAGTPSPPTRQSPTPTPRAGPSPKLGEREAPAESGRYTPPQRSYRLRPRWHRVAGWSGVIAGILIAALNDGMLMTEGLTLLPFGHSELYLILAVFVAGASSWFLGLFDRGTTVFE